MLDYIKDHIIEELHGAVDYWTKALENKGTDTGMLFKHMADAEIEHANTLTKMLKHVEVPKSLSSKTEIDPYKEILDEYTIAMNKIEAIKKLYWSK